MLFKESVDGRTHARTDVKWTTDNGPLQKLTFSTLCSGELKKEEEKFSMPGCLEYNTYQNIRFITTHNKITKQVNKKLKKLYRYNLAIK